MSITTKIRGIYRDVREDVSSNGGVELSMDSRTVGVLVLTSVLLALFFYYGRPGYFRSNFQKEVLELLDMKTSSFKGLFAYWYWAFSAIFFRVAIPLGCIWFWFKHSAKDYGFRIWEKGHAWIYLGLFLMMLPLLVGMSFTEGFQNKYPFYDNAGDSVLHFVLYQLAYGIQFASLEAFFRGFLIFALFRKFGYYGIVIMTIPYCMIHFGKPIAETLGAIAAGHALGYLAIKSKSWIPGALLHWGIGIAMDLSCILQKAFNT